MGRRKQFCPQKTGINDGEEGENVKKKLFVLLLCSFCLIVNRLCVEPIFPPKKHFPTLELSRCEPIPENHLKIYINIFFWPSLILPQFVFLLSGRKSWGFGGKVSLETKLGWQIYREEGGLHACRKCRSSINFVHVLYVWNIIVHMFVSWAWQIFRASPKFLPFKSKCFSVTQAKDFQLQIPSRWRSQPHFKAFI